MTYRLKGFWLLGGDALQGALKDEGISSRAQEKVA